MTTKTPEISFNSKNNPATNFTAVTTIVKMGSQWVKVTPLMNNQAICLPPKQAHTYGKMLEQPATRFVQQIFLGNFSPFGEIKQEFMEPGKTTVIASQAQLNRYNQDKVHTGTLPYNEHVPVPYTFAKWQQDVSNVLQIAVEDGSFASETSKLGKQKRQAETHETKQEPHSSFSAPLPTQIIHTSKNNSQRDDEEGSTSSDSNYDSDSYSRSNTQNNVVYSKIPQDKWPKETIFPENYVSTTEENQHEKNLPSDKSLENSSLQGPMYQVVSKPSFSFEGTSDIANNLTNNQKITLEAIHELFDIYQQELTRKNDQAQASQATKRILARKGRELNAEATKMRMGHGTMQREALKKEVKKVKQMYDILRIDIDTSNKLTVAELKVQVIQRRIHP